MISSERGDCQRLTTLPITPRTSSRWRSPLPLSLHDEHSGCRLSPSFGSASRYQASSSFMVRTKREPHAGQVYSKLVMSDMYTTIRLSILVPPSISESPLPLSSSGISLTNETPKAFESRRTTASEGFRLTPDSSIDRYSSLISARLASWGWVSPLASRRRLRSLASFMRII